ncbi:hypothetical protein PN36_26645, partial [Candidatus Thiomargarita nelsonii]
MSDWMAIARKTAEHVYDDFLKQVVIEHVLKKDRIGQLSEKQIKKLDKGDADNRTIRLMSISGKGGFHKEGKYDKNTNVTLLDHLLSVTRGSLLLATMNWLSQNPDIPENLLKKKLAVIAVTAFLHDLDKDLELARTVASLNPAQVADKVEQYGIDAFLKKADVTLTPEHLLHLIEQVETSQAYRHLSTPLPRFIDDRMPLYVRMADKLDGIWLEGGITGVIKRLETDKSCLDSPLLPHWQAIDLFDPHHPFLLDKLQFFLSQISGAITGVPPLLEGHHDGRLTMLLPKVQFDEIVDKALNKLADKLPFGLEVDISNVGVPALLNGQPTHTELQDLMLNKSKMPAQKISKLLKIQSKYKAQVIHPLDALLDEIGLKPRFPKSSLQLVTLYDTLADFDADEEEWLRYAAHLALMLNLKVKNAPLTYDQREAALLSLIPVARPEFIQDIEDNKSR